MRAAVRGVRLRIDRTERGLVAGAEVVAPSLLVFVVGLLVVANAWAVVDAKAATASAARVAARTYARSAAAGDPTALAIAAGHTALAESGRIGRVELVDGSFARCVQVTFRVSVSVPSIPLAWLGAAGSAFGVSADASDLVDPYRSGVGARPPGTICG